MLRLWSLPCLWHQLDDWDSVHYQHSCCINDHFAKILYNICITTLEYYSPRIMREKTPFNLLTWLVSILKHTWIFHVFALWFCYVIPSHMYEVQNRPKVQFNFSSLILKELEFFLHLCVIFKRYRFGSEWDCSVEIEIKWNILKACIKYVLHFIYDCIYMNYCETSSWNSETFLWKIFFQLQKVRIKNKLLFWYYIILKHCYIRAFY